MEPYNLHFALGHTKEAVKIMKEAAHWLSEKGEPLWFVSDIDREVERNNAEDFIVLYEAGKSVAAMIFNQKGYGM